MGLSAGSFNQRVTIQRNTPVRAVGGAMQDAWSDVATLWANVRPVRGKEFFAAAQMQDSVDHTITLRYRNDITRDMRVVWNGTPLDIVSIIDVNAAHENLELMCASGVRGGR